MITEQAIVTRRDGKRVEVELQRQSACGGCELNRGCGTGALGRLLGHRRKPLIIEADSSLEPGDRVELGLSEAALVRASLVIYGLPLLGMLCAGLAAAALALADGWVALVSAAGFYGGYRIARIWARDLEARGLTPYIVDIKSNPVPRSGS